VSELRDTLKIDIKAAWSQEAVRRGVAAAKVYIFTFRPLLCTVPSIDRIVLP
jgi:hypothetical protein